jgi:ABC-type proline/glycine betaine transport system permease subunit
MNAVWEYLHDNFAEIKAWTLTTLWLSLLPLAIALVLAVPAGWFATRRRRAYDTIVGLSGTLYTIPSLVLFLVLPELLGTKILSAVNVAVALTIYRSRCWFGRPPTRSTPYPKICFPPRQRSGTAASSAWWRWSCR